MCVGGGLVFFVELGTDIWIGEDILFVQCIPSIIDNQSEVMGTCNV